MHPQWPGGPPPGWYPDPAGERAWRWWDGHQWTGFGSDPTGPGAFTQPSVDERLALEQRAAPWARRGLLCYPAVIAVGALVAWGTSSPFHQLVHDIRVQSTTGVAQTTPGLSLDANLFSLANLVLSALFYVPFLLWQFQAATAARLLFLPARRSAGLGIAGWFIPVANLWFPYQAIRDCLPPGDPGRRTVGRMWAAFIATNLVNTATVILAVVGSPVGFVVFAVGLALAVTFVFHAGRAVGLIGEAHRRLLAGGGP